MKNLWLFVVRYNAFFWFLIFFTFAIILVFRNNNYQQSYFINSSNSVIGTLYAKLNYWINFINLEEENKILLNENALLRKEIQNIKTLDSLATDSALIERHALRYDFIPAHVVNNSVNQKNNFITLDKGKKSGIEPDMGVITSEGVVGLVLHVSEHFSTVKSLLNTATTISVTLDSLSGAFGSLVWGQNTDPRYAIVKDIPNHINVKIGQPVYTSGFSTVFPKGIKVGEVIEANLASGTSFNDVRIALSTNFTNLPYVYIIKDKLSKEKLELESSHYNND